MKIKLFKSKKDFYKIIILLIVFAGSLLFSIFIQKLILHQPQNYSNVLWASTGSYSFLLTIYACAYSLFLQEKPTNYFVIYLIGFFVLATALGALSALMQ